MLEIVSQAAAAAPTAMLGRATSSSFFMTTTTPLDFRFTILSTRFNRLIIFYSSFSTEKKCFIYKIEWVLDEAASKVGSITVVS